MQQSLWTKWLSYNESVNRKEEILKAAYEITGDEGVEALNARSVAAKVGVNHALVHYYFPRREDLLMGVAGYLKQRFEADVEHFQSKVKKSATGVEASLTQCEAYCKPTSRLYRVWASLFVAAQSSPELRKLLLAFWQTWSADLGTRIDAAVEKDAAHGDSPFADGNMLLATMLGVGLLAQLAGNVKEASIHLDAIDQSLLT